MTNRQSNLGAGRWFLAALALCVFANAAAGDTINFSGSIIQSIQDGTGPAINNPGLNNVQDLQAYSVTVVFNGSIGAPGTYNLTGADVAFADSAAHASEGDFGFISATITANGVFEELSFLACLRAGSGCLGGNQLSANFRIPAAMLNSQNVSAAGLDQPHPLDLLEDDGTTDIHGSISLYSYTGVASAVPEPSLVVLLGCVLGALIARNCSKLTRGEQQ